MENFYIKEPGARKSLAKETSKFMGGKSSGDKGFSLAELRFFHWLGFLLVQKKIFLLPPGVVKWIIHLPVGDAKVWSFHVWGNG